nr:MAG TPA: hypothetical protein [Crassvirales sp.]
MRLLHQTPAIININFMPPVYLKSNILINWII